MYTLETFYQDSNKENMWCPRLITCFPLLIFVHAKWGEILSFEYMYKYASILIHSISNSSALEF